MVTFRGRYYRKGVLKRRTFLDGTLLARRSIPHPCLCTSLLFPSFGLIDGTALSACGILPRGVLTRYMSLSGSVDISHSSYAQDLEKKFCFFELHATLQFVCTWRP